FLYGNAEVTAAETSMQASFYDIVIYPKGMYHTEHLQFDGHQEILCVWVDIPGLEIPSAIRIQDSDASVKWLLENLHAEYKSEKPSQALINHYVKTITILIAKRCFAEKASDDPVSRVMLYIQDHMTEELTVEQLSSLIYVSKSYLSRIFKQQTGLSLIEYLRLIRVETAKALLISSNTSVTEISYIIGYNSPKYFCRAFRSCTGMSPREFKAASRENSLPYVVLDNMSDLKKGHGAFHKRGDLRFVPLHLKGNA
ncbi:MAG: AraC family transcriptional regulator, partial [Bacillota bacterium]